MTKQKSGDKSCGASGTIWCWVVYRICTSFFSQTFKYVGIKKRLDVNEFKYLFSEASQVTVAILPFLLLSPQLSLVLFNIFDCKYTTAPCWLLLACICLRGVSCVVDIVVLGLLTLNLCTVTMNVIISLCSQSPSTVETEMTGMLICSQLSVRSKWKKCSWPFTVRILTLAILRFIILHIKWNTFVL